MLWRSQRHVSANLRLQYDVLLRAHFGQNTFLVVGTLYRTSPPPVWIHHCRANVFIHTRRVDPYNAGIFLCKPWRTKGYKCFTLLLCGGGGGIEFRHQIMTSI